MRKSIGILYLCTGEYKLFWDDFYKSFQEKFMKDMDKTYYVFCDDLDYFDRYKSNNNIKIVHIDSQPWPLITLLRFRFFISIEEDLQKHDYLMFSNANIVCNDNIIAEEFWPRPELGEHMCFVNHPGYYQKKAIYNYLFDRNKNSKAYIPYNCGQTYVIGAMFGGESKAFMKMAHILNDRIEDDLKRNVIALWHDESHMNRYIVNKKDYRLLHPGYCYPVGFDLDVPNKISGVSKMAKFDVDTFKGFVDNKGKTFKRIKARIKREGILFYLRDSLLHKTIENI